MGYVKGLPDSLLSLPIKSEELKVNSVRTPSLQPGSKLMDYLRLVVRECRSGLDASGCLSENSCRGDIHGDENKMAKTAEDDEDMPDLMIAKNARVKIEPLGDIDDRPDRVK